MIFHDLFAEDDAIDNEVLYHDLGLCSEMRPLIRHGQVIVPPTPNPNGSDAKGQVRQSARTRG